jgi:hypothetical protein
MNEPIQEKENEKGKKDSCHQTKRGKENSDKD